MRQNRPRDNSHDERALEGTPSTYGWDKRARFLSMGSELLNIVVGFNRRLYSFYPLRFASNFLPPIGIPR